MTKSLSLGFVLLLFTCVPLVVVGQSVESSSKLVGTWRLLQSRQILADGSVRPESRIGPKAVGYIIYSDTGVMCAFLSNPDRPRWKDENSPTEADMRSALDGMVSYCGTYEINEREGYVTHHVEMDRVPNVAGTDRKRFFTVSGNHLILRPVELPAGVKDWTIEWERVKRK